MIAAVVTFGMVGCAGQNPRHMNMSKWHGSDMKRVDHGSKRPDMNRGSHRRTDRPDSANHRQRGEAREKFEALRKRNARKGE
jgi:hypothetical protein